MRSKDINNLRLKSTEYIVYMFGAPTVKLSTIYFAKIVINKIEMLTLKGERWIFQVEKKKLI